MRLVVGAGGDALELAVAVERDLRLGDLDVERAGGEAARATVYLEGRPVWSCVLSSEGEFEISGVQVVVENGCARIARSDCPDLYCVSCGPISRVGESLVCLPNRVSVTLSGEDMPDAVIY